jgi:hypothetical protein
MCDAKPEGRAMTDMNEIVRIAVLGIQRPQTKETLDEFVREIDQLPDGDKGLVFVARKLLAGQKYQITRDGPANVDRVLALARAIGAEVDISEADGPTRITFTPAARQ